MGAGKNGDRERERKKGERDGVRVEGERQKEERGKERDGER